MSKAPAGRKATRAAGKSAASGSAAQVSATQTLPVGRPLQSRLIALERRIGLFSEEGAFSGEGRFRHPVVLQAGADLPAAMAQVFATELAALERLGRDVKHCFAEQMGDYGVYCLACFSYDGFNALLYVEHRGKFLAGWHEAEVNALISPTVILLGAEPAAVERFLDEAVGRAP